MNICYYHKRHYEDNYYPCPGGVTYGSTPAPTGGETIAMEEIQPWFFETLEQGNSFEKKVGKARCSDEDNYCKKTGREYAASRLKTTKLHVIGVHGKGTSEHVVVLMDDCGDTYHLIKYANSTRVYLSEYN